MSDSEVTFPSTYDYFYFDISILRNYVNLNDVKNYAEKELNLDLFKNLRGLSYFIELVLINIVDHVEGLINNSDVYDVIHWGESSIGEDPIKELVNSEPIVKYIFELNGIRKKFTKIRTKSKISEKDIVDWIVIFKTFTQEVEKIDIYIRDYLGIKQLKQETKPAISNWFQVKYNYVEGDCKDPLNWGDKKIVCSFPGGAPFFYTMPRETRKAYHLEHPIIKNFSNEYLTGYKIVLTYFYSKFLIKEQYVIAKKKILGAKNWYEIHKAYGAVIRLTEKEKDYFTPFFEITKKEVKQEIVSNSTITKKHELDLIFRRINNLRMKIIRPDSDIGEWGSHSLFYHVLFGARQIQHENIEVIEFQQEYEEQAMIEYSYAIFIPISGAISDSSYWILFDRTALSSTKDSYKSTSKYMIDGYFKILKEKSEYNIKTYHLKGDLLKNYIKDKDFDEKQKSVLNEQVKTSKGLIGQFIAYLFLAKEYDAKLIDISKNIGSTDIDVIAENEENFYLVQAKSSFPITNESINYLKNHFEQIQKHIKTSKNIKKVLFLISEQSEEDTEYMLENELDGLSSTDVDDRIKDVKSELAKEQIEIKTYPELKKRLSGKEYVDLLAKIDSIVDYFDPYDPENIFF